MTRLIQDASSVEKFLYNARAGGSAANVGRPCQQSHYVVVFWPSIVVSVRPLQMFPLWSPFPLPISTWRAPFASCAKYL
jgi:hypothetical protein